MSAGSGAPPAGEAASAGAGDAPDPSWDLYALLSEAAPAAQLSSKSTDKDISTAYRRKARILHPDRNPDPNATTLFHQLQIVFNWLSDPVNRSAYDAKLAAAAVRLAKDAALDSSLATMKRNLLAREAEAALAAMQAKNAAREAALNPRAAQSAADISRAQNEALIRSMQAQGAFDGEKGTLSRSRDTVSEARASKLQRTSTTDSSVHGGSHRSNGLEQKDSGSDEGNEKQRTLVLRWAKSVSIVPTSAALHALVDRLVPQAAATAEVSGRTVLEHVFVRTEKRKAMLVFFKREDAATALPRIAVADATATTPEFEAKWMDEASNSDHTRRAPPPPPPSHVFTAIAATPTASTPSVTSTISQTVTSSFSTPAAGSAAPSFSFGTGASAALSPADYEQATLMRMAAIAKQNKLKKLQQQQVAAEQAAHSTPAAASDLAGNADPSS